jgi:hypothetical protein
VKDGRGVDGIDSEKKKKNKKQKRRERKERRPAHDDETLGGRSPYGAVNRVHSKTLRVKTLRFSLSLSYLRVLLFGFRFMIVDDLNYYFGESFLKKSISLIVFFNYKIIH